MKLKAVIFLHQHNIWFEVVPLYQQINRTMCVIQTEKSTQVNWIKFTQPSWIIIIQEANKLEAQRSILSFYTVEKEPANQHLRFHTCQNSKLRNNF